jgi:hypothetical protein
LKVYFVEDGIVEIVALQPPLLSSSSSSSSSSLFMEEEPIMSTKRVQKCFSGGVLGEADFFLRKEYR